jgi:hypothetical protein
MLLIPINRSNWMRLLAVYLPEEQVRHSSLQPLLE